MLLLELAADSFIQNVEIFWAEIRDFPGLDISLQLTSKPQELKENILVTHHQFVKPGWVALLCVYVLNRTDFMLNQYRILCQSTFWPYNTQLQEWGNPSVITRSSLTHDEDRVPFGSRVYNWNGYSSVKLLSDNTHYCHKLLTIPYFLNDQSLIIIITNYQ